MIVMMSGVNKLYIPPYLEGDVEGGEAKNYWWCVALEKH